MNNVVEMQHKNLKCPVGSIATHVDYGWCEVIAASGLERTVEVVIHTPDRELNVDDLPIGIEPEEILFSETITTFEHQVDVRDLREAQAGAGTHGQKHNQVVSFAARRA